MDTWRWLQSKQSFFFRLSSSGSCQGCLIGKWGHFPIACMVYKTFLKWCGNQCTFRRDPRPPPFLYCVPHALLYCPGAQKGTRTEKTSRISIHLTLRSRLLQHQSQLVWRQHGHISLSFCRKLLELSDASLLWAPRELSRSFPMLSKSFAPFDTNLSVLVSLYKILS